jgi:hypothetical protein
MVEIPSWQPTFIIHVKYFFVVLALPSDDGQWWLKHVKAIFYTEPLHSIDFVTHYPLNSVKVQDASHKEWFSPLASPSYSHYGVGLATANVLYLYIQCRHIQPCKLAACFLHKACLALQMEAGPSSETSVSFYNTTQLQSSVPNMSILMYLRQCTTRSITELQQIGQWRVFRKS